MPQKPIYINLIRKPLDRLVSYYYFLRYGDNFRPNLVRKKAGDKMVRVPFHIFSLRYIHHPFLISHDRHLTNVWRKSNQTVIQKICGYKYHFSVAMQQNVGKFTYIRISLFVKYCCNLINFRNPGSLWALEQAKQNLVNNYFLVGVTEEMEDFIYLLELSLPR